jgi:anti-sigma regulatory factor (Ser/Thr protein kinase)/PAS domain-containing protein
MNGDGDQRAQPARAAASDTPVRFEVSRAGTMSGSHREVPETDTVTIDAASARDLDFFTGNVAPAAGNAVTRPIVVLRGPRRSVINVTASGTTEGTWRLALGEERTAAIAPDTPERVDARLEELDIMVWLTDAERLARWFNSSWLAFVGATLADQLGWGWMRRVHPDDLRGLLETYESAQQTRHGFEHTIRVTDRDDVSWWVLVRAAPRTSGGRFEGFIGMCQPLGRAADFAPPPHPGLAEVLPPADLRTESPASVIDRLANLEAAVEVARPALTVEAAFLRRLASQWLSQHESLRSRHDEVVLAVGEAAANSALHAYRGGAGVVQLGCEIRDAYAEFRVRDWGEWRPPAVGHDGHGLALMSALSDALEVKHMPDGTEVVLRYRLVASES